MIDKLFGPKRAPYLQWAPEIGVGFFDCDHFNEGKTAEVYDESYFAKYRAMATSETGLALNAFRAALVLKYAPMLVRQNYSLLDVGIGDGAFLSTMDPYRTWLEAFGCDINPTAIAFLIERGQLGSYGVEQHFDAVTFWDSLEHFRDPRVPLRAVRDMAYVSIPIFHNADHALRSRHYRKDEHFWYFTREGFLQFAHGEGFDAVDIVSTEVALGREDIETFVLKRRS